MRRRQDWAEALNAYIDTVRDVRFQWGVHECSTFAADAVCAMTDNEVEMPSVPSARAYADLLHERGSQRGRTRGILGEDKPVSFANRGDVVLLDLEDRNFLGICIGIEAVCPGPDGVIAVPMSCAIAAWAV
jgi:hypothetical protein